MTESRVFRDGCGAMDTLGHGWSLLRLRALGATSLLWYRLGIKDLRHSPGRQGRARAFRSFGEGSLAPATRTNSIRFPSLARTTRMVSPSA